MSITQQTFENTTEIKKFTWWSIEDIAILTGMSESHVRQKVIKHKNFPKKIFMTAKWRAADVLNFFENNDEE